MNDEKPVCINRPGFCIFGCIKLVTNNAHVVTKNLRRNITKRNSIDIIAIGSFASEVEIVPLRASLEVTK